MPVHGLALLTIVLLATPWLAQVPRLSAAAALTLVGAQMFGRDTEMLWQYGYRPGARPARQCAVVGFWLVLAVSLTANNALVGFIAIAVVAGLVFQFRRLSRRRRRAIVPF